MPHRLSQDTTHDSAYIVLFRGLEVRCETIDHVVEAVRALEPLEHAPVKSGERVEREVPVPRPEPIQFVNASPVATAVYDLFRAEPTWRRPVEIVKALKRRRVPGAKYTSVYAVLRYGDFVKREGRWNVKDAQAAL